MKPFNTLSHKELVALTEEDVQTYIDFACAEKGIPLAVEEAPVLPTKPIQPEIVVYEVCGVHFDNMKDAEAVQKFIVSKGARKIEYYRHNYNQKVLGEQIEPPTISTVNVYSHEQATANAKALTIYETEKKKYDDALSAERNLTYKRDAAAKPIREAIEKAGETFLRRQFLVSQFERYEKLAKGDRTVALRFLREAHPDSVSLCADLFESDNETVAEAVLHGLGTLPTDAQEIPF